MPETRSELTALLGRAITHVEGRTDGTLTLVFEGGLRFVCYDPSPQYESYHIQRGDMEIHV